MRKISILDSTLRDGAQGEGISFSVKDKLSICQALDKLGIDYIEAGNPGSNPKDQEFFAKIQNIKLNHSKICAFGSTRRPNIECKNDQNLQSLISAKTDYVVIFGKSWTFQVTDVLKTNLQENLLMIKESCEYLKSKNKHVFYDAEHFFTAYSENPSYALQTLQAAIDGGAELLCLCETKGGFMLDDCKRIVNDVVQKFGHDIDIGIHAHNDCGLAVANSLIAVQQGVNHVQGTLLGFGERTGNANLSTIIADLQLKMGYECIPLQNMKDLTSICKYVAEIANINISSQLPFVGSSAFAHKAGMHIDAVLKNPFAYEHISPEDVGNSRNFLMSEVAGRSTVIEKIRSFMPNIKKDDTVVKNILQKVKELEAIGYQFEAADGSFELLVKKLTGQYKPFFKLHYYQTVGLNPRPEEGVCCCATLKIEVNGQNVITAGEGNGPVNALDITLRNALEKFYPVVSSFKLEDYKVRVIDEKSATAAKVRVIIESSDNESSWTTIGISSDIIEASWKALVDSFEYKLLKEIAL